MKFCLVTASCDAARVAPARERGLKCAISKKLVYASRVAPARERGLRYGAAPGRIGHGVMVAPARERGLKLACPLLHQGSSLVAPARERGLKCRH